MATSKNLLQKIPGICPLLLSSLSFLEQNADVIIKALATHPGLGIEDHTLGMMSGELK